LEPLILGEPNTNLLLDRLRYFNVLDFARVMVSLVGFALSPGFTCVFKELCGLTALSVLSTCAIPSVIAGMREEKFMAAIKAKH
jgi:hypothetical protein